MPDHSSSRTTEHWFLDLDGVRSGPYQTPEVMSLVAEGEVMPHHRISTGLKDQPWVTVLDWRLEQAKKLSVHEPEVKEVRSYIPTSAQPPAPEPEPKIEIATETEVTPAPVHAEPEIPVTNLTPSAEEPPPPPPHLPRSKRDPMAEMFDVLQTSKQKREAKSQQIAQQHTHHPLTEEEDSKSSNNWLKTAGIGLLITVIGFALGQILQQNSPPQQASVSEKKEITPSPTVKTEIIDRSTDKMTIRSRVETVQKPNPTLTPLPTRPPQITRPGTAVAPTPSNGSVHTEKELQELKDLKKELQELKALKEELKQGSGDPSTDGAAENIEDYPEGANSEIDSGFQYYPVTPGGTQGGAMDSNQTYPQQNFPRNGQNGQPGNNSNVHY